MFSVTPGLARPLPQALPKCELGSGIGWAGRDVLGCRGEALQGLEGNWTEVLSLCW